MKTPISLPSFLALLVAAFLSPAQRGEVPEPDNILYGTITLDDQPVTASHSDVIVEARRSISGPAVARYRMGANSQFANFYSLRIPLESETPLADPNASLAGDTLVIVVLDSNGIRTQRSYSVESRAVVHRFDFGTVAVDVDSDDDGLLDSWENANFGNLGQTPNATSANGLTVLQNYVAGTNPNEPEDTLNLTISFSGNLRRVSFPARSAQGAGYEGLNRYYSLEYSTDGAGEWLGVDEFTNVLGNNQTLIYETTATNSPVLYRAKVWLQAP